MVLTKTEFSLYEDMKNNGGRQESWDWESDYRFALIINDVESANLIRKACDSSSVTVFRYAAVRSTGITQKRLSCLRQLVKKQLVDSYWSGLGEGAVSQYNLRRVRTYAVR